jgi:SET domain-containing protein
MYHFLQMPKAVSSLPKIERKKSKLHGYGVFALESINKNKRIIDYAGELISNKESEAREDRYLSKGCIWVFRVNRNWSRDAAVGGNVARFINHACRPNCWIEVDAKTQTIWVRAAKSIRKGQELTYDYNTEGDKVIPCRCRPGCKTKL